MNTCKNILKSKKIITFLICFLFVFLLSVYFLKPQHEPKVSVVMPVYNRSDLVERAINTILYQTFQDFEFIIVDDGSTDATPDILKKYAKQDPRVRIITNPKNCGIACARNRGNDAAKGKYIVVMDSDDIVYPKLIEAEYDYMEKNPHIVMVYSQKSILKEDGKNKRLRTYPRMDILRTNTPWNVGNMFRRDFIQNNHIRYDEKLIASEDYDFWAQIMIKGGQIGFLKESFVAVRIHSSNSEKYYAQMKENSYAVADKILDFFGVPHNIQNDVCQVARYFKYLRQSYFTSQEVAEYERFACGELKKNQPDVSIIISTYNYADYLLQTIDSVLKSTHSSFEIIVIDDGSTDNTIDILEKYRGKDSRIKVLSQSNQGLSVARNNALQVAQGRYVWFVDSDDWIEPNAIAKLVEKGDKYGLDLISFYTRYVDTHSQPLPADAWNALPRVLQQTDKVYTLSDIDEKVISQYPTVSGKNVYRREFLNNNGIRFPSYMYFEDDVFFLHTIFAEARIGTLTDVLYVKRLHPRQITNNRSKYFSSTVRLPIVISSRLLSVGVSPERIKKLILYYTNWAIMSYLQFEKRDREENLIYLKELLTWVESVKNRDFLKHEYSLLLQIIHENTPDFKAVTPVY